MIIIISFHKYGFEKSHSGVVQSLPQSFDDVMLISLLKHCLLVCVRLCACAQVTVSFFASLSLPLELTDIEGLSFCFITLSTFCCKMKHSYNILQLVACTKGSARKLLVDGGGEGRALVNHSCYGTMQHRVGVSH